MSNKREERRQRAALDRQARERVKRQKKLQSRVLIVAGVVAVLGLVALTVSRRQSDSGGRVWSAEHGHWHDK